MPADRGRIQYNTHQTSVLPTPSCFSIQDNPAVCDYCVCSTAAADMLLHFECTDQAIVSSLLPNPSVEFQPAHASPSRWTRASMAAWDEDMKFSILGT